MKILVLNSGSSSQKASLYDFTDPLPPSPTAALWDGQVEWQGDRVVLQTRNSTGAILNQATTLGPRPEATVRLLDALTRGQARVLSSLSELDVVGHRIVNGGQELTQPTAITREVKTAIRSMSPLAPLHNRAELDGIEIIEKRMGDVLQVAVFDTGFHSGLPEAAAVYPGPYEWLRQGIRRYGFHGINHQYCAERAAQLLAKDPAALKLVTCHLGNGCSLAAIQGGRSVDTTMGFTPLEGLMMGTRSGSVDPGILTYLLRQGHRTRPRRDIECQVWIAGNFGPLSRHAHGRLCDARRKRSSEARVRGFHPSPAVWHCRYGCNSKRDGRVSFYGRNWRELRRSASCSLQQFRVSWSCH